eukprot:6210764-Pleurochrysis_carterae.AAC.1
MKLTEATRPRDLIVNAITPGAVSDHVHTALKFEQISDQQRTTELGGCQRTAHIIGQMSSKLILSDDRRKVICCVSLRCNYEKSS